MWCHLPSVGAVLAPSRPTLYLVMIKQDNNGTTFEVCDIEDPQRRWGCLAHRTSKPAVDPQPAHPSDHAAALRIRRKGGTNPRTGTP